jgi:two-component system, NtrC family, sensor kinase
LITDQRMPGMSGNELLQHAKALHPATIRVVVTAYSDLDPILKAVNDGLVARYIVKPWLKEDLDKVLSWAVEVFSIGRESSDVQLRLLKSERLITLGGMAGSVLHEIRNLLGPPKANAHYLLDAASHAPELAKLVAAHGSGLSAAARASFADLAIELPELCKDSMESVQKIEDVLDSYRKVLKENTADGGGRADPKEAIRYATTLLRSSSTGIEISYDGPERLPQVSMSQTELTQVLINLGGNAVQAFPRSSLGHVTIIATEDDSCVHFGIADDGPGMAPDVLARVGTPFFTTKEEGTGLGVSACRRLIAKAGGEFRIDSTAGKGTTVRFSLKKA